MVAVGVFALEYAELFYLLKFSFLKNENNLRSMGGFQLLQLLEKFSLLLLQSVPGSLQVYCVLFALAKPANCLERLGTHGLAFTVADSQMCFPFSAHLALGYGRAVDLAPPK